MRSTHSGYRAGTRRRRGATALIVGISFGTTAILMETAPASAAPYTRLESAATNGDAADGFSFDSALSANGRYLAFASGADNLSPLDEPTDFDIFRRDRWTGLTELVSVTPTGQGATDDSEEPWISADGRYVAFSSFAEDLVAGDENGQQDVFLRDMVAGVTEIVSVGSDESPGDDWSFSPSISDNGRYVEFSSNAALDPDDGNGFEDIYVRDRLLGVTTRGSVKSSGADGELESFDGVISGDGLRVAFSSDYEFSAVDLNFETDVYYHDFTNGATNRVSSKNGTPVGGGGYSASMNYDGRLIAFISDYALTGSPPDTLGWSDVFVRNTDLGSNSRVSFSSTGGNPSASSLAPRISSDGRYVSYISAASDIVTGDTNGLLDLFIRDRTAGTNVRVNLAANGGDANAAAFSNSLSGDGRFVAFATAATNLSSQTFTAQPQVFVRSLDGDAIAPTIAIATPAANASYARGSSVTVDFSCADDVGGAGVQSCVGSSADGTALPTTTLGTHTLSVDATDFAGNPATLSRTYTVVDATSPTVSITTPVEGATYFRNQSVPASFECADEVGGSGLTSCVGPVANGAPIPTGTVGTFTFTVDAADGAGNAASSSRQYTVIDNAAPVITITTPSDGATYDRNATVLADYACTDDTGVASCNGPVADGAPIATGALGTFTFTVNSTDTGGNASTESTEYTVRDVTAPSINVVTPIDGSTVDRNSTVLADYSCTEEAGGSGLASCSGSTPDGSPLPTVTLGTHTLTVDATDVAGNSRTASVSYTVRDSTAPAITIASPLSGATFSRQQSVRASYSCADESGGSGVATCSGTVPDASPIDTTSVGTFSFSVTATDVAGNSRTQSVTYSVSAAPLVTVGDATIVEGDFGSRTAKLALTLSHPTTTAVTVTYSTQALTATAGSDYMTKSGSITFAAGTYAKTISITLKADTAVESDETFAVNLTSATNAILGDAELGVVTQLDDDTAPPPGVRIVASDATIHEGNSGGSARTVTFAVSLAGPSPGGVSVQYAVASGTATAGSDFVAKTGTLTFAAGATAKYITVKINSDSAIESNESFTLTLSSPVAATLTRPTGTATILTDD